MNTDYETNISNAGLTLHQLPYDILLNIFTRLDCRDLIMLSRVNKSLNSQVNDNLLWKIKLAKDMHSWRMIDSKTWPKNLVINKQYISFNQDHEDQEAVNYKKIYLKCNPDLVTNSEILKKLKTFQHIQSTHHATSTSESLNESGIACSGKPGVSSNLTLSSLSSFAMPMVVYSQIKEFVYRNVFNMPFNSEPKPNEFTPKLVMFGPGLETSTSCLVTNILWKSEFKTTGMVPGKDGYGSGIKLKLFNHKPFNLTILYTNVSTVRSKNKHELNVNRLLTNKNTNQTADHDQSLYELNPQVRDVISDADGFVYVIDNNNDELSSTTSALNYTTELKILMEEAKRDLPLLILSLKTDAPSGQKSNLKETKKGLSCAQIVQILELNKLDREWQIRSGLIFEPMMKGITLGFEWILNELDHKYYTEKYF